MQAHKPSDQWKAHKPSDQWLWEHKKKNNLYKLKVCTVSFYWISTNYFSYPKMINPVWRYSQYPGSTFHTCMNMEPPVHRVSSKVYFKIKVLNEILFDEVHCIPDSTTYTCMSRKLPIQRTDSKVRLS